MALHYKLFVVLAPDVSPHSSEKFFHRRPVYVFHRQRRRSSQIRPRNKIKRKWVVGRIFLCVKHLAQGPISIESPLRRPRSCPPTFSLSSFLAFSRLLPCPSLSFFLSGLFFPLCFSSSFSLGSLRLLLFPSFGLSTLSLLLGFFAHLAQSFGFIPEWSVPFQLCHLAKRFGESRGFNRVLIILALFALFTLVVVIYVSEISKDADTISIKLRTMWGCRFGIDLLHELILHILPSVVQLLPQLFSL